jgi:hypothetical protein
VLKTKWALLTRKFDTNRVEIVNAVERKKFIEIKTSRTIHQVWQVVQVCLCPIGAGNNELQRTSRMRKLAAKLYCLSQASDALPSKIFKLLRAIFLAVDSIPKSDALGAATSGTYKLKRT